MNIPLLIGLIVLFIFVCFSIYYMYIKNKRYNIPSLVILDLGLVFLILSQIVQRSSSWDNLIYVVFGLLLVLLSIATELIVIIVRYFKKKQNHLNKK